MQVWVVKSATTTRPRSASVVSGGEFSHPVAPSRDGILPSAARRPGAQPGPRIAPRIVPSRDGFDSMTRASPPVRDGPPGADFFASAGAGGGTVAEFRPCQGCSGAPEVLDEPVGGAQPGQPGLRVRFGGRGSLLEDA